MKVDLLKPLNVSRITVGVMVLAGLLVAQRP